MSAPTFFESVVAAAMKMRESIMLVEERHHERLHITLEMVDSCRLDLSASELQECNDSKRDHIVTVRKLVAYRVARQIERPSS